MQVDLNVTGQKKISEQYRKFIANDPLLKGLLVSDPAAIEIWVDNNVSNLNEAKFLFKKILLILRYLIRDALT